MYFEARLARRIHWDKLRLYGLRLNLRWNFSVISKGNKFWLIDGFPWVYEGKIPWLRLKNQYEEEPEQNLNWWPFSLISNISASSHNIILTEIIDFKNNEIFQLWKTLVWKHEKNILPSKIFMKILKLHLFN